MTEYSWKLDNFTAIEYNSQIITLRDNSGNTITINDIGKLLAILQDIYKLKYSDW